MFTGIVRERGEVASFDGARLVLETPGRRAVGDSIAVDGVCLTVVAGDEADARVRRRARDAVTLDARSR